jgi:hypothetical protein
VIRARARTAYHLTPAPHRANKLISGHLGQSKHQLNASVDGMCLLRRKKQSRSADVVHAARFPIIPTVPAILHRQQQSKTWSSWLTPFEGFPSFHVAPSADRTAKSEHRRIPRLGQLIESGGEMARRCQTWREKVKNYSVFEISRYLPDAD